MTHSNSPLSEDHLWSAPNDLATCTICNLPRKPTRRASERAALPVPAPDPLPRLRKIEQAAQAFSDVANEPYTVADKTWPSRYDAARAALRAALREGETP